MFNTLNTLLRGASARAEDKMTDIFAVDLLDQKIRDSEAALKSAKMTLAGLIQKERLEERQLERLTGRIADLTERAQAALEDGAEALAEDAANAIADLENEAAMRRETVIRLKERSDRLRLSLERAARRLTDLRLAARTARAAHAERRAQRGLTAHALPASDMSEAEALVARIMGQDDPFEADEIFAEIDAGLTHSGMEDRLSQAGYGTRLKSTGADVLSRLKSKRK